MLRYGLCCKWHDGKIKFKSTTVKKLKSLTEAQRQEYVGNLITHNVKALKESVDRCIELGIGSFRISSEFFPCSTHPEIGYMPWICAPKAKSDLLEIGLHAYRNNVFLLVHPSQFVVMNSPREDVVEASMRDIERESMLLDALGLVDRVIIIHGGGGYGDNEQALVRLGENLQKFEQRFTGLRNYLCIENDDKVFTAEEIYNFCNQHGYRMIFDFHHHRCNLSFDGVSEEEIANLAASTWQGTTPVYHISSPKDGWNSKKPRLHADYIDPNDFPEFLLDRDCVLEVEAKAKESAIAKLLANRVDKEHLIQAR